MWSGNSFGRADQVFDRDSLLDFIEDELKPKGVDLYVHNAAGGTLDTSTPHGRALFQMSAVFAELEAAMIKERVTAGIRKAQREGTKSGRPFGRPRISPEKESLIRTYLAQGHNIRETVELVRKKLSTKDKKDTTGTATVWRVKEQIRRRRHSRRRGHRKEVHP